MIKRRFFRQDHGDNSASSSSSSSSGSDSDRDLEEEEVSDDEVEEQQEDEQEASEDESEEVELEQHVQKEGLLGSGYQSEDSSGHDVDGPSVDDDDDEHISPRIKEHSEISLPAKKAACGDADSTKYAPDRDDTLEADFASCVLKCKSVYKCKICPRIMCLNEEMVRVHLQSKRHARSKKLLGEGRLKLMLNSDGELEEEQETHAERHVRTIALAQQVQKAKKDSGRQRQDQRRKKRARKHQGKKQEMQKPEKKRSKK